MKSDFPFTTGSIPDPRLGPALKWGVLAPGKIADRVVASLHRHSCQRVVAVGSRSRERAEQFRAAHGIERAYPSYEQLVADKDVDAIYIASPHSFHAEHALLAIRAGKHVLIEKPIARNAVEASRIFDAGRAAGVLVMEAMWMRFLPQADLIREILDSGYLGEIVAASADHGQRFDYNPVGRLFAASLGGGAMLDLGIYALSLIHLALGSTSRIVASGILAPTDVDATVGAVLRYPGAQGFLSTTLKARTANTAVIVGSDSRLEMSSVFYMPTTLRLVMGDGRRAERAPEGLLGGDGRVYQFSHFARLVSDGLLESPLHRGSDSIEILRMSDRIRRLIGAVPAEEQDPLRGTTMKVATEAASRWLATVSIEDVTLARNRRPHIPGHLLREMLHAVDPERTAPGYSPRLFEGLLRRAFWDTIDAASRVDTDRVSSGGR